MALPSLAELTLNSPFPCAPQRPAVAIFYLVLRGLDTVEDDMSLKPELKRQLLLDFHNKLYEPGWTFDGSGPDEKDRHLLVEFDVVCMYALAASPACMPW